MRVVSPGDGFGYDWVPVPHVADAADQQTVSYAVPAVVERGHPQLLFRGKQPPVVIVVALHPENTVGRFNLRQNFHSAAHSVSRRIIPSQHQ